MKLHLETNIAEGTPEELVEYLRLVEGNSSDNQLFSFGHAHQPDEDTLKSIVGSLVKVDKEYTDSTETSTEEAETSSTGLQIGDRVRVLRSACGAVGEATVTAILEDGDVLIAGTSKCGIYLSNWSSHVLFLEKIEEEEDVEDVEVDPEEVEAPMGYTFWYLDGTNFNTFVVLKASLEGYFEDSTGKRYTYQAVRGNAKPVTTESVREVFEEAEREGSLLKYFPTVDMFDKVY